MIFSFYFVNKDTHKLGIDKSKITNEIKQHRVFFSLISKTVRIFIIKWEIIDQEGHINY